MTSEIIVPCDWFVTGVADRNAIFAIAKEINISVETSRLDEENQNSGRLFTVQCKSLTTACSVIDEFRWCGAEHLSLIAIAETPFGRVECVLEGEQPRAMIAPNAELLADKARLDWLATRPEYFKRFAPKAYAELRNVCVRNDDPIYRKALNDSLDAARAEDPVTASPALDGVVHAALPKIGANS